MDAIDTVIELLNYTTIKHRIDEPIDRSLATFQYTETGDMNHDRFNRIITDYINHLYHVVFHKTVQHHDNSTSEEAVWLLEKKYKSDTISGYEGALLDAVNPKRGISFVLEYMKELIKAQEREKYIAWVFAAHIDPSDWQAHVRIVEELLERYKHLLTDEISSQSPRQLALHYQDLITSLTSTLEVLQPLLA